MSDEIRFDFPPKVKAERRKVLDHIDELLAEDTRDSFLKAKRLHCEWVLAHPDDYIAINAGEVLAMLEYAYKTVEMSAMVESA